MVRAVDRAGDVTRITMERREADGRTTPDMTVEVRPSGLFLIAPNPNDAFQLLRFPVRRGDKWETGSSQGGPARTVREVGETEVLDTALGPIEAVPIFSDTPDLRLKRSDIW